MRSNDVDTILGGPGKVAHIVGDDELRPARHRQFDHEIVAWIAEERAQEEVGLATVGNRSQEVQETVHAGQRASLAERFGLELGLVLQHQRGREIHPPFR